MACITGEKPVENKKLATNTTNDFFIIEFNGIDHSKIKSLRCIFQIVLIIMLLIMSTTIITNEANKYYLTKIINQEKILKHLSYSNNKTTNIMPNNTLWQKHLDSIKKIQKFITLINYISHHFSKHWSAKQINFNSDGIKIDGKTNLAEPMNAWISTLPVHCAISQINQDQQIQIQCQTTNHQAPEP